MFFPIIFLFITILVGESESKVVAELENFTFNNISSEPLFIQDTLTKIHFKHKICYNEELEILSLFYFIEILETKDIKIRRIMYSIDDNDSPYEGSKLVGISSSVGFGVSYSDLISLKYLLTAKKEVEFILTFYLSNGEKYEKKFKWLPAMQKLKANKKEED